jgi:hypothetical protein
MMRKAILPSLAVLVALSLAACSPRQESSPPPAAPVPEATPAPEPETPVVETPAGAEAPPVETPVAEAPSADPDAVDEGEQGGGDKWRAVATPADRDRIKRLGAAWKAALREADAEHGAEIDTLGMLMVPTAGLTGNLQPPPGAYRCRTVKVGSMSGEGLSYVAYGWFKCTIELTPGGDLILTKTTGSQRTRGLLYPGNDRRLIFLGAQAWGSDETGYPAYGQMPERDQAGVLQRIGENRWRLVLPWPKQESKLDVMELVR